VIAGTGTRHLHVLVQQAPCEALHPNFVLTQCACALQTLIQKQRKQPRKRCGDWASTSSTTSRSCTVLTHQSIVGRIVVHYSRVHSHTHTQPQRRHARTCWATS
jgi:hypothetical protein